MGSGWCPESSGRTALAVELRVRGRLLRLGRRFRSSGCDRADALHSRQSVAVSGSDLVRRAVHMVAGSADPGGSEANCTPGTRHFGDLGRNSLVGPELQGIQLFGLQEHGDQRAGESCSFGPSSSTSSIIRTSRIRRCRTLSPTSGRRTAATGRQTGFYQITATGDVGIGNPFLGGGGPRGIQFAAKITF